MCIHIYLACVPVPCLVSQSVRASVGIRASNQYYLELKKYRLAGDNLEEDATLHSNRIDKCLKNSTRLVA